ncbi:MAG TPA: cytochrome c3 family protein [Myxococcales bacterium]
MARLVVIAALTLGCGTADPPPALATLAFSHEAHVAQNQIGCGVCHPNARHAPVAGLTAMSTCVGCHKFVARDKPEVQKLLQAFADGRPLEFPRVNRLPDHVYFTHERHLAAGVECSSCHGDVAHMRTARSVHELNMGFCMDCHRQRRASIDCLACHK